MKLKIIAAPIEFLRQTRTELTLVNWPSRKETLRLTYLVIIVSSVTAIYLGGLDAALTSLFASLINR